MRRVDILKRFYNKDSVPFTFGTEKAGEGVFHAWGVDYEDSEDGPGNFSTAIVELNDGTVQNVPVELVRFRDSTPDCVPPPPPAPPPKRTIKEDVEIWPRWLGLWWEKNRIEGKS